MKPNEETMMPRNYSLLSTRTAWSIITSSPRFWIGLLVAALVVLFLAGCGGPPGPAIGYRSGAGVSIVENATLAAHRVEIERLANNNEVFLINALTPPPQPDDHLLRDRIRQALSRVVVEFVSDPFECGAGSKCEGWTVPEDHSSKVTLTGCLWRSAYRRELLHQIFYAIYGTADKERTRPEWRFTDPINLEPWQIYQCTEAAPLK